MDYLPKALGIHGRAYSHGSAVINMINAFDYLKTHPLQEEGKPGDIRINVHKGGQTFKQVYTICIVCNKGRWTTPQKHGYIDTMCKSCSRKKYLEQHPEYSNQVSMQMKEICKSPTVREARRMANKIRYDKPGARQRASEIQKMCFINDPELAKRIGHSLSVRLSIPEEKEKRRLSIIKMHKEHPMSPDTKKRISESNKNTWLNVESKEKRINSMLVAQARPELREKASERMKALNSRPEFRLKTSERMKARMASPDARNAFSQRMKKARANPEIKARIAEATRQRWADPDKRSHYIDILVKRWADPEFKDKAVRINRQSLLIKPNKPEIVLQVILNGLYPDEWKYTGDGSFIIGGLNPDFVNVNGDKKLLELFGDYWHSKERIHTWRQTELGRMMVFKSYGYEMMVIWEHELKEPEKVIAKIKQFHDMKVKKH